MQDKSSLKSREKTQIMNFKLKAQDKMVEINANIWKTSACEW